MKDYIVIGSVATKFWFSDYREPVNDIDILTTYQDKSEFIPDKYLNLRVERQTHSSAEYILGRKEHGFYMIPDELYTLKISHAHWNIKHAKTLHDIRFLKLKGCQLDMPMYNSLVKTWEEVHGNKNQVNLNKTMEEFFTDNVKRIHSHEYLHELTKYNDKPMHEYIRKDLGKVLCCEKMFNALALEQQYECALEEMQVTAIERFHLTSSMPPSKIRHAVIEAHKLLCTSMTKGWFARFLIMNATELLIGRKEKCKRQLMNTLNLLALSKTY